MKRIRLSTPIIASRPQAEDVLGQIRELTIERNTLILETEQFIKAAHDTHKERLTDIDQELQVKSELIRNWAEANPSEFGNRKSLDMIHGTIGWRIGMPKLVKKAKETWDDLVAKVREGLGELYIRHKEQVDRESIIRDAGEGILTPAVLRSIGLSVTQDESFFVDPKIEEPENRQTVPAEIANN
jgi:phage host-nuclease inhibitor protein Gam